MKQLEGFNDRTDRICHLIKTFYSLKQAGREWNTQFNEGVEQMGFRRLLSDSCVYIRWQQNDFQIITVWVDNLLLFTNTEIGMHLTKTQIAQRWHVTNIGKLTQIIGIEITLWFWFHINITKEIHWKSPWQRRNNLCQSHCYPFRSEDCNWTKFWNLRRK